SPTVGSRGSMRAAAGLSRSCWIRGGATRRGSGCEPAVLEACRSPCPTCAGGTSRRDRMTTRASRQTDMQEIVRAAKRRFPLNLHGIHGIAHWQRVRENGLRVAKHTGADRRIVELFAFLHDCCREDDGSDPGHGERAAAFAESLRGTLLHLDDEDFALLF